MIIYKMGKVFFYLGFMFSFYLFFLVLKLFFLKKVEVIEWQIFNYYSMEFGMLILLDWISILFMSYMLFISSWVLFYSFNYMSNDKFKNRFFMMMILFIISMILLIISPNLISLMLGWDGLGLISYCLVGYYQNYNSYNSSMITFLSNRIGDSFLLLTIFLMMSYGGWNYIFYYNLEFNMLMLMMLILASMTKSAQIPFSLWLPMAMAAPTPVSSLVHSSTLVTAGIYLLIRFFYFLMDFFTNFNLFFYLFLLTMLLSSLSAFMENDLKKIIALSTLSQLSLMFLVLFMGLKEMAFFHLLIHAIFKSLLFMCSGIIIHDYKNFQDIRMMGSYSKFMPLMSCYINISGLSLCGMPFMSGFYTKDFVMELMFMEFYMNFMIILFYWFSIGLTLLYYFRLIYYLNFKSIILSSLMYFIDNKWFMMNSMKFLMMFSLLMGSIMIWLFMEKIWVIMMEDFMFFLIYLLMLLIMVKSMENLFFKLNLLINWFNLFFLNMWYLKNFFFNKSILMMGFNLSKIMEKGWGEFLGGQGIYLMYKNFSMIYQIYHFNNMKFYLVLFIMMFYMVIYLYLYSLSSV
uniref:NADH-ubiquinone oxidoreductase chain 5 n=1 Tax=Eoxenos laboulbenei TaxID=232561 RepID=B7ZE84_9NEOP|nr:NADH dehydrogenase subunit 5 [Eoxenos laboulbenei]